MAKSIYIYLYLYIYIYIYILLYIYIIELMPIGEVFECFFLLHVQLLRPIYESRS